MSDDVNPFTARMQRELIRYYIMRQIFCVVTNAILDIDTCVTVFDPEDDADLIVCVSPEGWDAIAESVMGRHPEFVVNDPRPKGDQS